MWNMIIYWCKSEISCLRERNFGQSRVVTVWEPFQLSRITVRNALHRSQSCVIWYATIVTDRSIEIWGGFAIYRNSLIYASCGCTSCQWWYFSEISTIYRWVYWIISGDGNYDYRLGLDGFVGIVCRDSEVITSSRTGKTTSIRWNNGWWCLWLRGRNTGK